MNIVYIREECRKRGVFVRIRNGPVASFYTGLKDGVPQTWNSLVPIDDESDAKFVDFIVSEHNRLTNPAPGLTEP